MALQVAQLNAPPADVPGEPPNDNEAAALVLRIDRLENELHQATGTIEQLQNQQHRLEEQLKRFHEDVEFRLNGGHGAAPASDATPPAVKPVKKSDAFDPSADPNAVGAPRPIGTTPPSAPLGKAPTPIGAPLDLSHSSTGQAGAETPAVIAGIGPSPEGPRDEYNAALEAFRLGQYEQAEQQLRGFVAKNGGSRLVPDAIFYIGETYFQRSRPREAAEQYLKLSTDYPKSARAPEALLRLGQSLAALGSNDQACATFGEVAKRYPNAATSVKKNAEREMQKDHC
jgi:tol-pal system protein YbgF